MSTAVPALYDAASRAVYEAIISFKKEELGGRSYGTVFSNADFVSMQTCIHGVILEKMIGVVEVSLACFGTVFGTVATLPHKLISCTCGWLQMDNLYCNLPENFALAEDEEHSKARQALAARAKILKESEAMIERLAASVAGLFARCYPPSGCSKC